MAIIFHNFMTITFRLAVKNCIMVHLGRVIEYEKRPNCRIPHPYFACFISQKKKWLCPNVARLWGFFHFSTTLHDRLFYCCVKEKPSSSCLRLWRVPWSKGITTTLKWKKKQPQKQWVFFAIFFVLHEISWCTQTTEKFFEFWKENIKDNLRKKIG